MTTSPHTALLILGGSWLFFVVSILFFTIWPPFRDRRKGEAGTWGVRGERQRRPLLQSVFQAGGVLAIHIAATGLNTLFGGWVLRDWNVLFLVVFSLSALFHMVASGNLYEVICYGNAFRTPSGRVWFSESPVGFSFLALLYAWSCFLSTAFVSAVAGYVLLAGVSI